MSVLEVDPPRLAGCGVKVSAAGDALAGAVSALGSALSSSGQMCGDDAAGKAFAVRYGKNGQALLSAAQAAVNAARRVGYGIQMSASNYARCEAASRLGGGTSSVPVPGCPAPLSGVQMADPLGPAVGEPVLWAVVSQFVGSPWPDGNPATLRAAAVAWRGFGAAVAGVDGDISAGSAGLAGQDVPEQGQINSALSQLGSAVQGLGQVCGSVASSLESFAAEIESSQQAIRDLLDRLSAAGILEELGGIFAGHDPWDDVKKVAEDIKQVLHTLNREADGASAMFSQAMDGLDGLTDGLQEWGRKEFTHFLGDDVGNKVADVVNAHLDVSEGAAKSVLQTVGGVQELVTHPQDLAKLVIEGNPVTMAAELASDPKGFVDGQIDKAKGLLDAKDWGGAHPLRGLGNNLGNLVQVAVPGLGEAKAAAATSRVAEGAEQVARGEGQMGRVEKFASAGTGSDSAAQESKLTKDLNAIDFKPGQPDSAPPVKPPEAGPEAKPDIPTAPRGGEALPASPGQHAAPGGGVHEPSGSPAHPTATPTAPGEHVPSSGAHAPHSTEPHPTEPAHVEPSVGEHHPSGGVGDHPHAPTDHPSNGHSPAGVDSPAHDSPPRPASAPAVEGHDYGFSPQNAFEHLRHPGEEIARLHEGGVPPHVTHGYDPLADRSIDEFKREFTVPGKDGSPRWDWENQAPNDGFAGRPATSDRIPEGHPLDRLGSEKGGFLADDGAPLSTRGMPPGVACDYRQYVGTGRPIPADEPDWEVRYGPAKEAFGQPGGASQWAVIDTLTGKPVPVEMLKLRGLIREISQPGR